MIYDVSETRFYDLLGIKEVSKYSYTLFRINNEDNIVYFNLKVELEYIDINNEHKKDELLMPIEFNIRPEETLDVDVNKINLSVVLEKGVELEFFLDVKITESIQEQIKEEYQEILIESLDREIVGENTIESPIENEFNLVENIEQTPFDLKNILKNDYQKYKMLPLNDETTFNKISLKYNIPLEELYRLKKEGLKVLVYAKE